MPKPAIDFPYEIYDAHHHFWDLDQVHYPWLATKGIKRFFGDPAPIQRNYLYHDLQKDIGQLPVKKSIHIQVGADKDQHFLESQTIQDIAQSKGLADGIIAYASLESDDINLQLDQLTTLPNLRGIRQIIGRSPQEDKITGTDKLTNDSKWLEGLKELEKRNLSFDLQLIPDQMLKAVNIFQQVPNLKVALCHCGSPWYRDSDGWAMWEKGLVSIAELPNSMCKVSGLSMFDHQWTVDSLRPIIETVISIFGSERVMFGSNFPVDKLHTDYARLWFAYLEIVNGIHQLNDVQKQAMFRDNCARFYKLESENKA
ncbi:amidohydrolase family protein [Agarilytica rhodophyticola]|uniref:amidohydrolase family protein n=1 Tax=Agarilytica rhodophyticola TaxID=1737490 RepID=UPI000B3467EA|nr:amidohydrolase family protein [Agarilytica rhodophyticola]